MKRGTLCEMSTKSKPKPDFVDELTQLATSAFLAARKKAAAAVKMKAEAKQAKHRAIQLQAMVSALGAPPVGENGSYGFVRSRVEHDEWPWRIALAKRGMCVADYARQQVAPPLGKEMAKQWLKPGAARQRPIPLFWAQKIAADFVDAKGRSEVPAVDASWPHGIKRG